MSYWPQTFELQTFVKILTHCAVGAGLCCRWHWMSLCLPLLRVIPWRWMFSSVTQVSPAHLFCHCQQALTLPYTMDCLLLPWEKVNPQWLKDIIESSSKFTKWIYLQHILFVSPCFFPFKNSLQNKKLDAEFWNTPNPGDDRYQVYSTQILHAVLHAFKKLS